MSVVVGRETGLASFVPRLVVDWRGRSQRTWWRREGSMVSADISGFTKLSERLAGLGKEGAEELTDLINECFDAMIDIAAERGGDVLKFGGDALLLLFTGPDHLPRACDAAIAMRASIARPLRTRSVPRVTLRMSQGIHAGSFDFFVVDAGHRELLVTGPGASATVECEGEAQAGEILLSAAAAAAAPGTWLGGSRGDGRLLRRVEGPTGFLDLTAPVPADDVEDLISPSQREQIEAGVVGEHRQVTTAFVKFSHVDELVEHGDVDGLADRLGRLAASVRRAVERYDVHWLGTDVAPDGGKVILTAGAPLSAGGDEDRMLRAVHDIVDEDPGLHLRAGVNAGPVFAGVVGSRRRRVYTVMGDAVNLAARLMQRASAGEVLATLDTVHRAATTFVVQPLEPFHVKGKSEPIQAARVGAVQADHTRAGLGDLGPPFVGRAAELARLGDAVAAARRGETVVVDVTGDVGIGKTRLLQELRRRHDDLLVVRAAGGQYLRDTPYLALRGALRQLAGIPADAAGVEAGRLLAGAVERVAPVLRPWLPLLAVPFDADAEASAEVEQLAPAFRRERLHAVVRSFLAAVPGGTLLLEVDDAHLLDEASAGLLAALAVLERPAGALVVTARVPGAGPDGVAGPGAIELALDVLDAEATEQLVRAAATSNLLPDVVATLVEHAGGRPLFVVELARAALAHGQGELPDSIESLVTARIDTLSAPARRLLREASVMGNVVDTDLAAAAFGAGADLSLWAELDGFLQLEAGEGRRLRFRHSTYQAVAYAGLPFRRRRELHERVGRALEARPSSVDIDGLLSFHFHRAQVGQEAWRYSLRAGEAARRKFANVEAAELFRRALDGAAWARHVPADHVRDVWTALGDVCELSARYAQAAGAYATAMRLSRGQTAHEVELLHKRGVVWERSGRYATALRWYGRGLRLAETLPERDRATARCSLARAYAGVRYRQGRWAQCVRWAKQAAADAGAIGDRSALAHAWYLLDIALSSLGSPEAAEYRNRALPVFEELGDLVGQANALNNQGVTAYYESRWREAVDCYERSGRARDRAGDVVGAATEENNLGEVRSDQGHLDEARSLFERALGVWRAASYPVGVGVALSNLGRVEARAGNEASAVELLEQARRTFAEIGATALAVEVDVRAVECQVLHGRFDVAGAAIPSLAERLRRGEGDDLLAAILDRLHGWVLLRTGDQRGALDAFGSSLARAEALDARFEEALTRLAMAEVPEMGEDAVGMRAAGAAILAELDVVSVPTVPLTRGEDGPWPESSPIA